MKFDFVFVVLVYKNIDDLIEFFLHSVSIPNCKVIVVNSYFNEETEFAIKQIALNNGADFISVLNKGYGTGNNAGIEYAISKYDFKYVIVSNPDINILNLNIDYLGNDFDKIVAPSIKTLNGKDQNPFLPYNLPYLNHIKYYLFKNKYKKLLLIICVFTRLLREFYLKIHYAFFKSNVVYASHGSFIIVGKDALNKLGSLFNEKMFLFAEEDHLAKLCDQKNVIVKYNPLIKVLHKEDGSVGDISHHIFDHTRTSFIELFNYWYK